MSVDKTVRFVIAIIIAGFLLIMAVKYFYMNQNKTIDYEKISYDQNTSQYQETKLSTTMSQAEEDFPLLKIINIVLLFALVGLPAYLLKKGDITGSVMSVVGYLVLLITEPIWAGQLLTLWSLGDIYQIIAIIFTAAIIGGIGTIINIRDNL